MSIVDKIKKNSKKTIVLGGLAAAVLANPTTAKAGDQAEEDHIPVKPGCEQQLAKVVKDIQKAGYGQEKIAQYIAFPPFIPVTENGQFDKATAQELSQKLAPYIKDLADKGDNITAAEAYESFKKAVGETNLSYEEFKAFQDLAKQTNVHKLNNGIKLWFMAVGLLLGSVGTANVVIDATRSKLRYKSNEDAWKDFKGDLTNTQAVFIPMAIFALTGLAAKTTLNAMKYQPEQAIEDAYETVYDRYVLSAYADQTNQIKTAEAQKFEQMKEKWNKNAAEAKHGKKTTYDKAMKKAYDINQKDSR